jgi:hypothetical protein
MKHSGEILPGEQLQSVALLPLTMRNKIASPVSRQR